MERNYFNELVVKDFYVLKTKFQTKLKTMGLEFDEDLFVDTMLKCDKALINKDLPKHDLLKYWWVSYCNEVKRNKNIVYIDINDDIDSCDEMYEDIVDDIYNFVIKELNNNFDNTVIDAWINHICHNKSYKELIEMGYNYKFNNEFKKITRFIKNKILKTNKEFDVLRYNFYHKES